MVSANVQINLRGVWAGCIHGTILFVKAGQMPLVQALVAKTTFLAFRVPLEVRSREFPALSRSTRVTGVLVCRFTALRSTSLAASCDTNLYGQNEHAGTFVAARAPLKEVT